MSNTVKIYRFPYTKDSEGYPKVNREMTPRQYELYKQKNAQLRREILISWYRHAYYRDATKPYSAYVSIPNMIVFAEQDVEYYKTLPYPAPGYPERTVASSGEFILMAYMVLRYFDIRDISVEDLTALANFGGWHHPNGTWHHYLDVVCETYGIETMRLSKLSQIMHWMQHNGAVVALLDKIMFPESKGNCLVFITGIDKKNDTIEYWFPGGNARSNHLKISSLDEFLKHSKVLWGFSK